VDVRRLILLIVLLAGVAFAFYWWRVPEVAAPVASVAIPKPAPLAVEKKPIVAPPEKPPEIRTEVGPAGSLDRNVALDLFAQKIVQQDGTGTEEAVADQERREQFKSKPIDGRVVNRITGYLADWKRSLNPETASHFEIVSIECRGTDCEVLAVQNKVTFQLQGETKTPEAPVDMSTLTQEPWWQTEKFRMDFYNTESFRDYQLLTLYIGYPRHPTEEEEEQMRQAQSGQ
jgi:hypothetical protein